MMERKELTCIGCPMGCRITAEYEGDNIISVTGNTCPAGDRYARTELLHPERTVTSTVSVSGGRHPRISVKTEHPIPREKIFACMEEINRVTVSAPVRIGDVIIENAAGTGINVIATKNTE